ncbi:hypothetical protein TUN199_06620 [Pyrenophora tritici-repentis]|uniref:Uncharacterized protein n=1 Tax=Pyrenophora tritici-repentis TaxID=45151 RepID=A0A834S4P5_9PLEO|nr:hypothetical protein PtrM4_066240 [Pyrenophora tritici-repentis]KAI0581495.1 hypothetical protein Alg130_06546 [Pyrenophora tritici-repentis]KAI0589978.1 hypothetical protein Alg215_00101 [Pyrenophora tritici-repentis]KAI0609167.1 hypothetical protein TUN205_06567 [Pyrenophora tritici-repentis]KAI0621370.1 hypothetical protein TUN199_06620 [Pyrenophora tritici-repentis]
MAPATIKPGAPASQSSPQPTIPVPLLDKNFDDIFHIKFMKIIQEWKDDPARGQLTQKDRKTFIETAFSETDELYWGQRMMTDYELKLRALTKVFYKVLAEEPWSEDWIRAPDVERKLSKFEMHEDSVALAKQHGFTTPREAVKAARERGIKNAEIWKEGEKNGKTLKDLKLDRGPFDDIEIVYIAGTVSSSATSRIDRSNIYPVSVSSVANVLQNHICRDMVRPYMMAERFINCTDTRELEDMRRFACNVCDFCPHLLDNDNVSLLVVLLILSRSDCCRRFEANGIRIEGSTISHRKAECMKNKMGWKDSQDKKPYDTFAQEFQTRVKNACFPAPRAQRIGGRKPHPPALGGARHSITMGFPIYGHGQPQPHMGFVAPPQIRNGAPNNSSNNVHQAHRHSTGGAGSSVINVQGPRPSTSGAGSSAEDPMDLS